MSTIDGEAAIFTRDAVHLGRESTTRDEAIRFVGAELAARGHIDVAYVDGMLEREQNVSTYLGNGVAMPHGTFESRDAVRSTGIVVAQYPEGVDWGPGTAHLIIGLAATGDDHVTVLSHIAEVLQDEETAEALWTTTDGDRLFETLNAFAEDEDEAAASRSVTISGEGGLHARPATLIVEFAKGFDGTIEISKDGKSASATSIMKLLALGASANDTVEITVDGADSGAATGALAEIERILTTPEAEL